MTRAHRVALFVVTLSLLAALAFGQASPQAAPLPVQHIVFVVDNSSSMAQNDNMGLRGVAACLMLDAVELSSDVQAGLVKFNDAITTDGQLHPPNDIRELLQAGHLGNPDGGTNIQDALSRAIGMLSTSNADKKRIVLITDGQPSGGAGQAAQEQFILTNLVPNAKQAGIEIFALGLTNSVNPQFLEQITAPTGGRSQISQNQTRLLESAKALVGQLDRVYNIAETHLDPSQATFEFEVHPGTDRARATAMLDHPTEFEDGQIVFTLSGPAGDSRYYLVRAGSDRVAAWTSFFSTPGRYRLTVSTNRPGVASHLGMKLIAEALSNLQLKLSAVPQPQRYAFGTTVAVDAEVTTGKGVAPAGTFNLSGVLKLPSGATQPLAFNGARTTFTVPDVPGRHIIEVTAQAPPVAQATAQLVYEAAKVPVVLESNRPQLDFSKPLAPAADPPEEPFTLSATVPSGMQRPPVTFSFTVTQPVGIVELIRQGGSALQYGTTEYSIPDKGLKLALRIKIDPKKPLKREKVSGVIQFISKEAGSLSLPFTISVHEPEFKVENKRDAFALWWDPSRSRIVPLGRLRTDSSLKSTFSATLPDSIFDPVTQKKIADVALRIGDQMPEGQSDKGKLRYSDIELPPHDGVPIALVITPDLNSRWEELPGGSVPVPIELVSSFGVSTRLTPKFENKGTVKVRVLGRVNYGRDILIILMPLLGLAAILMFFLSTWPEMRAFRPFDAGRELMLRLAGPIRIGSSDDPTAALVLPNSDSLVDNRIVGNVFEDGYGQRVASDGPLIAKTETLAPGDELTIVAPDPSGQNNDPETVWGITYYGFVAGEGGAIEVTNSPKHWTVFRMAFWIVVLVATFMALRHFLDTDKAAEWAYRLLG